MIGAVMGALKAVLLATVFSIGEIKEGHALQSQGAVTNCSICSYLWDFDGKGIHIENIAHEAGFV